MITSREVDIYVNRYGLETRVPVVQYDSGRQLVFNLVDATLPSGCTAYIYINKPSGLSVYNTCTVSGNTVTVTLTNQALAEYGRNYAQIRIIKNEEVVTSFNIMLDVQQSYIDDAEESESNTTPSALLDEIALLSARVDEIASLGEGSTTGDAELADIRVGADGTVYENAGDAVRGQVNGLNGRLVCVNDGLNVVLTDNYGTTPISIYASPSGWRLNTNGLCSSDSDYKLVKYAVTSGSFIKVISDDKFQFQNSASVPSSGTSNRVGTTYGIGTFYVTVPEGASYLIVSTLVNGEAKAYSTEKRSKTETLLNETSIHKITDFSVTNGYFINANGEKQSNSGSSISDFIPVSAGCVIKYKLSGSANWSLLATYSEALQTAFIGAVAVGAGWSAYQTGEYAVPDGVNYIRFSYITENVSNSAFSIAINDNVFPRIKEVAESVVAPVAENIGTVYAANIPTYWRDVIDTKIQSIKTAEEYGTIAAVCSFVFVTDMHYPYNSKQSAKLIKEIVDNTNIAYILNGGDSIHNSSSEVYTPADCVKVLYDVRKDFKKYCLDDMMYSTMGNHDLNTQGSAVGLSAMQMYDAVYRKTVDYTEQGGWSWYYQDDKYHKVRFVSVNIYGMNQSQLSWIGDTALNVPDGWAVVLFAHALPFEKTDIGNELNRNALNLKAVLEAYQAKTTVNIADSSTSWPIYYTKDFSAYHGEIACYLAGHVHSDNVIADGGITYVTTLNDSLDKRASSGGTTNEQAFDVFTLNKGTKTLKATRIGSGSDRTISY